MPDLDAWIADRLRASAKEAGKAAPEIQADVADGWASRAVKAWAEYARTKSNARLVEGVEHAHEAIEHAAEAGDGKLEEMRRMLEGARARFGVPPSAANESKQTQAELRAELPALHTMAGRLGWKEDHVKEDPRTGATAIEYGRDRRIGASPLDALLGAFGDTAGQLAGQAGQTAARGAVGAASEEAQGQIPKIAAAIRGQIPGLVGAAAEGARPAARDIASEAGRAAGKGVREGAGVGGATSALPMVLGALVVVGAAVGVGYAVSASQKRKEKTR